MACLHRHLSSAHWFARLSCLLCLIWFAAPTSARAADEVERGMTVRLVSWRGDLRDLLVDAGGREQPARAGEFVLGQPLYFARRSDVLHFSRELPADDGKVLREKLVDVPLPEGATQVLVLLAPASTGAEMPWVGTAWDFSPEAHPPGTIHVLNLSTKVVALRVAGKTAQLLPRGDRLFPYAEAGGPHVPFEIAVQTADDWKMVSRGLRPTPPDSRTLCLIRDGRPTVDDPAAPVDAFFLLDRMAPTPKSLSQR